MTCPKCDARELGIKNRISEEEKKINSHYFAMESYGHAYEVYETIISSIKLNIKCLKALLESECETKDSR